MANNARILYSLVPYILHPPAGTFFGGEGDLGFMIVSVFKMVYIYMGEKY